MPGKLRILQLRSDIGFFGAERVVYHLAQGFQKRGHWSAVGLIHSSENANDDFKSALEHDGILSPVFQTKHPFDRHAIHEIRDFISSQGVQLVHSHGYKADFYAWAACRKKNITLVSTCHPWLETATSRKARFYTLLDKIILNGFDHVIAISESVRKECQWGRLKAKNICTIENGIDLQPFLKDKCSRNLKEELNIDRKAKVICTVGRLSPEKGHEVLLKAFSQIIKIRRDTVLLIVGDGDEKPNLQQKTQQLNIDRQTIFAGTRNDIPDVLAITDVFVLPSLTEGMPMALLEAMAAKKAIVATTVGDIPDIIKNNHSGLLVQPGDENSLANALLRLLDDEKLSEELSKHAFKYVRKRYNVDRMCEQYLKLYESNK